MKRFCTLAYTLALLTFVTLAFLPNSFAQGTLAQPSVRLVYFLPNDRPARPDRIEALRQLIKDAQQFYADEMQRHGYGRKTFTLETDRKGEPVVHRIDGKFTENYYYEPLSDPKVWKELYEHFDDPQHIYFVAIDLSHEVLNGGDSCGLAAISFFPTGGYSPVLARKIAVRNRHETRGEEALGGCSLIPASGKCFDRYDVTLHELGHAFGLEHDFRLGLESHYVMSFGKVTHYQMRLSECAAEWLSVSSFFNTKPVPNNAPGKIQLISTPTYSSDGIRIRFKITDADGLHQAQLLVPEILEYGAWGAERLFDCKRLKGQTNTIEFISEALKIEPVDRIMLQTIDVNGGITWATFLTDIDAILPRPKTISIPDKNLKKAIQQKLGLNPRANVTDRDMKTFRSLKIEDSGITNISGLEHATELEHLFLGRNKISNYNPLAQLSKLKRLFLWANGINNLNVLPPMPQLELLDLNWNQISDLSPLAEFTSLKELWLQGNRLSDTSTLFQLHNGIFPPDEEVKVTQERDNNERAYTLLTFQSLDLKVRINPDVKIYKSLNAVQNAQHTAIIVEVGPTQRPPMYWIDTTAGMLHRLVGTEVETLVPSVQNATSLAVDMTAGKLYWTERTSDRTGKIRRANLDGNSNVQLVKELTSVPYGIALDTANRKIYLTNSWGKVQRLNVDGSNFQPNLITGLKNPKGIAVDVVNHKVYWTEKTSDHSSRIHRANLDGSNVQQVKVLTNVSLGIAIDTSIGKIYLTDASGKVQRLNVDGSNFQPNLITELKDPKGIAVDVIEGKVYWTEKGSIRRASFNGENIEEVVTNLGSPRTLVLGMSPSSHVLSGTGPQETMTAPSTDINEDGKVNKSDLLLVVTALGEVSPTNPRVDVDGDGRVAIADLLLVVENLDDPVVGAAPTITTLPISVDVQALEAHLNVLRVSSDGSYKYRYAIAILEDLLASMRPTETQLLANYPNPFNPETWIPYELAMDTNVHITIYASNGCSSSTVNTRTSADRLLHRSGAGGVLGRSECAW